MIMISKSLALYLFILGVEAIPRTEPPEGALVVGDGQYNSLQEAVDASSSGGSIFLLPGTYEGQTIVNVGGPLAIYGYTEEDQDYTQNQVIITNNLNSESAGGNAPSGTLYIQSDEVSVYNLRIENTAGDTGPAHAISGAASRLGFYGCEVTGWQDTLYVDEPDQVFKNTYVEGAVDFIYGGSGNVWFETSDIAFSRETGGYITASGRDGDDANWYVINNSRVFAASGVSVEDGSVYLGRPWRAHARTVFQNTELSSIIQPEGWHPWDKGDDLSNIFYAEYGNTGDGADTSGRVDWSQQLSEPVSIDETMPGWSDWVDLDYWNA